MQSEIDAANAEWWNELCGSDSARQWGITDDSPDSLAQFDNNFFAYYPYLDKWLRWRDFAGKRVLEVGLGYGSITQRLAMSGAILTAMDIAPAAVAMAKHRFHMIGSETAGAIVGNILSPPEGLGPFHTIVAIGCLHHTGNLAAAIARCYDLLVPGGQLIGMVYNTFSHRQWRQNPKRVAGWLLQEIGGHRGSFRTDSKTRAYDHAADGSLAPSTEFASIRSLRAMCAKFRTVTCGLENALNEIPFNLFTRKQLLASPLPWVAGLDLYFSATK